VIKVTAVLWISLGAVFAGAGIWGLLIRFHDYRGSWQRFVAWSLFFSAPVAALWLLTWFNLFVFSFALTFVWASFAASWLLKGYNHEKLANSEQVKNETNLEKKRLSNSSTKDERRETRKNNKLYNKQLRKLRTRSVVPGALFVALAILCLAIAIFGLWFRHAQPGHDLVPWMAWFGVAGIAWVAIALRLLPKKLWLSVLGVLVAIVLFFSLVKPVFADGVREADNLYQSPAEAGEEPDSDVIENSENDQDCPLEFRLDDNHDGVIDSVPDDPDYPDSVRVAEDPSYLIERAEEAGIWEEGRYSVAMIVIEPSSEHNYGYCLDTPAWVAVAKLEPDTWEGFVRDEIDIQLEKKLITSDLYEWLVSQLDG
jgi:hypothetical protein